MILNDFALGLNKKVKKSLVFVIFHSFQFMKHFQRRIGHQTVICDNLLYFHTIFHVITKATLTTSQLAESQ